MKKRLYKKQSKKIGLPPGEIIHVGQIYKETSELSLIQFNETEYLVTEVHSESLSLSPPKSHINWLNINGVSDTNSISLLGERFGLHGLVLEDIVNTAQRPKVEIYDDHIFVVMNMFTYNTESSRIETEQISLILKDGWVLTFQEKPGDVFTPIRDRIQNKKGKIRNKSSDYLFYSLIDCITDQFFSIIEIVGDKLSDLEEQLETIKTNQISQEIYNLKRELIYLKKPMRPISQFVREIINEQPDLISESVIPYFKDILDHTHQISDSIESYLETATHILDAHLNQMSHRMNEVMKTLTIVASIFIPLTFIAGIYGMNFEIMPELKWKWGYPFTLISMLGLGLGSFIFLKRKKWF